MPNTKMKANYRRKRRSCAMCKPHKMHGADSRTMAQKKADISLAEQSNGDH